MKNIFKIVALAACLLSSPALAQFSQDAVVGSSGGGTPGGTSGQQQYNNSGSFGGFTQSGDCTTVTSTGVTSCVAPHPGYVVNNFYIPLGIGITAAGAAATANRITCSYGYAAKLITINNLSVRITTVGTSNIQLALYTNVGGRPGTLIDKTASQVDTSTGFFSVALGGNQQVGPGSANGRELWFCSNQNDSTVVMQAISSTSAIMNGSSYQGSPTFANLYGGGLNPVGVLCSGAACQGGSSTFNTWPASLATSTWTENLNLTNPIVAFQVISVP